MSTSDKFKAAVRDVKDFPKPGILFKDITPVLNDPKLVNEIVEVIAGHLKPQRPDVIAAVEARGFIFGSLLAHALQCKFVPIRKAGKLPYHTRREEYSLEYGKAAIEMHEDAIAPGARVIVHDDLLATGGTAEAAGKLVTNAGAVLLGFTFLINLGFLPGCQNLMTRFGVTPYYLVEY